MSEPRTSKRQRPGARWVLIFLATLVAVLATVFGAATAFATTPGVAETRVRALQPVAQDIARPIEGIRAGQRLGKDVAWSGIVVATGVAAKSADVVVPDAWNAATKLPSGGTVRDVGNRIWGHGLPSADRLAGMTDDELRALASLDDARMLNAMYRGAGPSVPNNATAPVRVDLSQLVIDAWSRK